MPFEFFSTNKIAGPAIVLLVIEMANAYTCPDTSSGIATVSSFSIRTDLAKSPERNMTCVGRSESDWRCTVTFCPGMGSPVMLRAGKGFRPREGLVDGHDLVN